MTAAEQIPIELADLVDLDAYPLHEPGSLRYLEIVDMAQAQIDATGCYVARGFLRPEGVARLAAEVEANKGSAQQLRDRVNPYLESSANPDLPPDHPANTFTDRAYGVIPGDTWAVGSPNDVLFRAPEVARYVAHCVQCSALRCSPDHMAGLTVTILEAGQQLPWHFDRHDVGVSVLVQEATEGGRFEYSPNAGTDADEPFDAVAEVLAGDRRRVVGLDLRPGDLQIFRGSQSLQRLTTVASSSSARHAAACAYVE